MKRSLPIAVLAFSLGSFGVHPSARAQGCLNQFQYPFQAVVPPADGSQIVSAACIYFQEYTWFTGIMAGATYQFTITSNGFMTVREGTFDGPVVATGVSVLQYTAASNADLFVHYNVNSSCAQSAVCQDATVQMLLDCVPPVVTFSASANCQALQYFVDVTVVGLGDANSVDITNNAGAPAVNDVGPGSYSIGPFATLDGVVVTVVHDGDPLCNVTSPALVPPVCPIPITCGAAPLQETYCYVANDNRAWSYTADGNGSLRLTFIRGTIESVQWDSLFIYDGSDANAPLLFAHTNLATYNLGPPGSAINSAVQNFYSVQVTSASGSLYMRMRSDPVVQCAGNTTYDPWEWEVVCLDCVIPAAQVTVVDDCPNNSFTLPVNVTSTGDGSTVSIAYSVNGGAQAIVPGVGLGVTVLGPFTIDDVVTITLLHESSAACTVQLGSYTDTDLCPTLVECGAAPLPQTYCYGANESKNWSYQSVGGGSLRLRFNRGTIQGNVSDQLSIHDGPDALSPVLFQHNNNLTYNLGPAGSAINNTFTNYYGVEVFATGPQLFMRLTSNATVHCGQTTTFDAFDWDVVCLDCQIPAATASVVDDCPNQQFSVEVNITSLGDGASAGLSYTVNGGAPTLVSGLPLGVTTIGPFAANDVVNVQLLHATSPACTIDLGNFTETGTCPTLVDCGTSVNEYFCHGNFEDKRYYYQGTGIYAIAAQFNAGTLEVCCDRLYVYDGGDITAPLLTPPGGLTGNLAGLIFVSTNPEHRLTVRVTTDVSISCLSGSNIALDWTVSCLDCSAPQATFGIELDCANEQYSVEVNVTAMGSDPSIAVTNTAGAPPLTITSPGVYLVGPIPNGTPVQVTLVNDDNALCNVTSPQLTNPICPEIICGEQVLAETYCYGANENKAWSYELPGSTGTLRLTFQRGTIESAVWDVLRIYDGNAPIPGTELFVHSANLTYNLGPVGSAVNNAIANYHAIDVTSTTGRLYMTLTSDGVIQCTTTTTYDPFEWTVYCEGCQAPGVAYNLVPTCTDRSFVTEVIVTEAPSAQGLEILNTQTNESVLANAIGVYDFGPYAQNAPVSFQLTDLSNPQCYYLSDTLTFPSDSCVIRTCGWNTYTYCYGNNEDRWYTWQSITSQPITLGFYAGQMLPSDRIVVYNGFNENAAVLYQGNNGGSFLGFAVSSMNTSNALTLRIQSNGSGSCADGQATVPLDWYVACGGVGVEEVTNAPIAVHPNPTTGLLTIDLGGPPNGHVRTRVLDMSGRAVLEVPAMAINGGRGTLDLGMLARGQYVLQLITDDHTHTVKVDLQY